MKDEKFIWANCSNYSRSQHQYLKQATGWLLNGQLVFLPQQASDLYNLLHFKYEITNVPLAIKPGSGKKDSLKMNSIYG